MSRRRPHVAILPFVVLVALVIVRVAQAVTPPTIEFLVAPAPGDTVYYFQPFSWMGTAADGTVPYYRWAIDPPPQFPYWVETNRTQQSFFFRATDPVEPLPPSGPIRSTSEHTFVVKAVDNDGNESAEASRTFRAFTIAPEVQITSPVPNPAIYVSLPSDGVTIDWQGIDWDGLFSNRPVKYKYRIFRDFFGFNLSYYLAYPDSLRKLVAPGFVDWDSTSSDSASVTYTNLTPQTEYLFVVVGFDEAGAYSPRFGPAINMLWMRAAFPVGVDDPPASRSLDLSPPSPNPAQKSAALRFVLPRDGDASLVVYDATGREVRELVAGRLSAGPYAREWDLTDRAGRPVAAGLYFARLVTPAGTLSRRLVVIR